VYVPPIIHLTLCLVVELGDIDDGWLFLTLADIPIGLLLFAKVFRDGQPMLWFGVFGTLWWYLLSWSSRAIWRRVRGGVGVRP
jgi:hypothetical protein